MPHQLILRTLRLSPQLAKEIITKLLISWGYGNHVCPGRFFASNEMKIALCFMLLRYDFEFLPGETRPKDIQFEVVTATPDLKVRVKRRQEEIDLLDPMKAL